MLLFAAKDLLPVVTVMKKNKCAMMLVKDHGIYVLPSVEKLDEGSKRTLAYAEGYDPDKFVDGSELYDACVAAVGGDDFAESLPLTPKVLKALATGQYDLLIAVTETQIRIDLSPVGSAS